MTKIVIDPMTRVSGVLGIDVVVKRNVIVEARCRGNQFRGFERMFQGRDPLDMIRLTPRICGICSTHHTLASTLALEDALGVEPDDNGKLARQIINCFEFLQNHIRQLCFFAIPDYVDIINLPPLTKSGSNKENDYRLSEEITKKINKDLEDAAKYSRLAHRAVAILAGKVPHCHGIYVGGITTEIGAKEISSIIYTVNSIKDFIDNVFLEDILVIADQYKDYYKVGRGYGNFIDGGIFEGYGPGIEYSKQGVFINGIKGELDTGAIKENLYSSWLESGDGTVIPGDDAPPIPNAYKKTGYSWVTAPRYNGYALEGGPLARMVINGYYSGGISAMDRIVARAMEASKLCECIQNAVKLLKTGKPYQQQWKIPESGEGIGITGAARGCLIHWIKIKNKTVENYAVIPPSNWNLSPTDAAGVMGPVEKALVGTIVDDEIAPIQIGRIVRSFDPCLNCAAHIISDRYEPVTVEIL